MNQTGATFYTSVDEVPGLAKTVDEAVRLFEPFKERLKNMEDNEYEGRFCTNYEDKDKDAAEETPEKPRWGIGRLFNQFHW